MEGLCSSLWALLPVYELLCQRRRNGKGRRRGPSAVPATCATFPSGSVPPHPANHYLVENGRRAAGGRRARARRITRAAVAQAPRSDGRQITRDAYVEHAGENADARAHRPRARRARQRCRCAWQAGNRTTHTTHTFYSSCLHFTFLPPYPLWVCLSVSIFRSYSVNIFAGCLQYKQPPPRPHRICLPCVPALQQRLPRGKTCDTAAPVNAAAGCRPFCYIPYHWLPYLPALTSVTPRLGYASPAALRTSLVYTTHTHPRTRSIHTPTHFCNIPIPMPTAEPPLGIFFA